MSPARNKMAVKAIKIMAQTLTCRAPAAQLNLSRFAKLSRHHLSRVVCFLSVDTLRKRPLGKIFPQWPSAAIAGPVPTQIPGQEAVRPGALRLSGQRRYGLPNSWTGGPASVTKCLTPAKLEQKCLTHLCGVARFARFSLTSEHSLAKLLV